MVQNVGLLWLIYLDKGLVNLTPCFNQLSYLILSRDIFPSNTGDHPEPDEGNVPTKLDTLTTFGALGSSLY